MYSSSDCFLSWKSLLELSYHQQGNSEFVIQEEDVKSFQCYFIDYETYLNSWKHCELQMQSTRSFSCYYSDEVLSSLFISENQFDKSILKMVEDDVSHIVTVSMTPLGRIHFQSLFQKMESFLICLLGHVQSDLCYFAVVLLNVL